jgi:hypothetical protein
MPNYGRSSDVSILANILFCFLFLIPSAASLAQTNAHIPWYIALHAGEADYDISTLDTILPRAKELGVKGIRTDIFWLDIEPKEGEWDEAKIAFYRAFFEKIRQYDMDIMMILSGAPKWAQELYKKEWDAGKREKDNRYWEVYNAYVEKALEIEDGRSQYIQIWNESNLDNYSHVKSGERWLMFSLAGERIRAHTDARILVNVFVGTALPWLKDIESWLEKSGEYVDVVGLDHFPMTWSLYMVTDWSPVEKILLKIRNAEGPWANKKLAIAETGFSSWIPGVGDRLQDFYVESTLKSLYKIFENDPTRFENTELLGWYQLVDVNSGVPGSLNASEWLTESKFGVLTDRADGYKPKRSFDRLKDHIRKFYEL